MYSLIDLIVDCHHSKVNPQCTDVSQVFDVTAGHKEQLQFCRLGFETDICDTLTLMHIVCMCVGMLRVQILVHKVGFLVCIAIGILYIVLMPIVGFFLACCRCCGNCGGKMYQEQSSSIHCCRKTLYWCAFATTIIIL